MSESIEKIVCVIPAYNEERTIRDVASRAHKELGRVIVVDDGSTVPASQSLQGVDVTVYRLEENGGKAKALMTGIKAALEEGADGIITLDGDGQHRPEDIPALVQRWRSHKERIVIGSRLINRENYPKARLRANLFANFWVAWASGYPILDSQSGFRLYPRKVFEEINLKTTRNRCFVFESEILIEAGRRGFRTIAAPIEALYHHQGRASHFRPVADITHITLMVAWKLFIKGFYPAGLYRSLTLPPE